MEKNDISAQEENFIQKSLLTSTTLNPKEIALNRSDDQIDWYTRALMRNRRFYTWSTTLAVVVTLNVDKGLL